MARIETAPTVATPGQGAFETEIKPDGTVLHRPATVAAPASPDPKELRSAPTGEPAAGTQVPTSTAARGQSSYPPGQSLGARRNAGDIRREANQRRRAEMEANAPHPSPADMAFLGAEALAMGIGASVGGPPGAYAGHVTAVGGRAALKAAARSPQAKRVYKRGAEVTKDVIEKIPDSVKGLRRVKAFEYLERKSIDAARVVGRSAAEYAPGVPRSVGQAFGAGTGAAAVTAGAEKLGHDPGFTPEESFAFAGGIEGAIRMITPTGGPIQRYLMRLYHRIPWVSGNINSVF